MDRRLMRRWPGPPAVPRGPRRLTWRTASAVALAGALVAAGCGGGEGTSATSPTSSAAVPAGTAPAGRNGLIAVVIVVAAGVNSTHRIDLITPAGQFVRRLPCVSGRRCVDSYPAWSPTGRALAYSTDSPGGRIMIVRADGARRRELVAGEGANMPDHPSWSPTGSRIAFMRGSHESGNEIFTIGRNGTGLRRIARGPGELPSWSAAGRIAVGGLGPAPIGGIRTFRARDGANLRRLTGGDAYAPAWSPDAKRIAYVRCVDCGRTNRLEIWIMRADGTAKRRLTRGVYPAWSPDARLIAFTRGGALYTIPANGGTAGRVPYTPRGFSGHRTSLQMPAWQPRPR